MYICENLGLLSEQFGWRWPILWYTEPLIIKQYTPAGNTSSLTPSDAKANAESQPRMCCRNPWTLRYLPQLTDEEPLVEAEGAEELLVH